MREWLRAIRLKMGMTELDVARKANIAQPFYHNIEMGLKNPSVETAKKIALVLCFAWTRFFEDGAQESGQIGERDCIPDGPEGDGTAILHLHETPEDARAESQNRVEAEPGCRLRDIYIPEGVTDEDQVS